MPTSFLTPSLHFFHVLEFPTIIPGYGLETKLVTADTTLAQKDGVIS